MGRSLSALRRRPAHQLYLGKRLVARGAPPVEPELRRVPALRRVANEPTAAQSHAVVPAFYLKPDDDSSNGPRDVPAAAPASQSDKPQQPQTAEQAAVPFDRYFIVKAKGKSGKRVVGDIKIAIYGKVSQQQNTVKTTITGLRGGWLKLTPVEQLSPGEYAIVEMLGKDGMNLYVWDFGVSGK